MIACEYDGCGNEATSTALEIYLSGGRFLDASGLNVCADHLPYHEEGGPCPEKMIGVWNSRRVHLTKEIGDHRPAFTWREVDAGILRRESGGGVLSDIDEATVLLVPQHLMVDVGYYYWLGESKYGGETKVHMVKGEPFISVFVDNMTMRRDYQTRCGKVIKCYSSQENYVLAEDLPEGRDLCKFCDGTAKQWPGHYHDSSSWEDEAW